MGCGPWNRKESDTTKATDHTHTHMLIKNHDIYLKAPYSNSLNNSCYNIGYLNSGIIKEKTKTFANCLEKKPVRYHLSPTLA